MSTQAIGIDFGTAKTLVAYPDPHEKRPETLRLGRGADFVPGTAAIDAEGQHFFGGEHFDKRLRKHADALATKGEE